MGFLIYADEDSAYAALCLEVRRRCDYFEEGKLHGSELSCDWYPMCVTWHADGHLIDEHSSEFLPW